jgi:hypothetical protein
MTTKPDIWIVMVEQYYANHVGVLAVCDSEEEAQKVREEAKLGDDVHIYPAKMNERHPTV